MDILLKCSCYKYEIPAGAFLARDWSTGGKQAVVLLCSAGGLSCILKLTDTRVEADTIMRAGDSTRYFILKFDGPAETKRVGIGFQIHEESAAFVEVVQQWVRSLGMYGAPAAATSATPPRGDDLSSDDVRAVPGDSTCETPMRRRHRSAAVPLRPQLQLQQEPGEDAPLLAADRASEGEDSSTEEAQAASDIHGEEPVVKVEADVVQAPHATLEAPDAQSPTQQALPQPQAQQAQAQEQEQPADMSPEAQAQELALASGRKHACEDSSHPKWHKHKKHMFVLSIAGKPIYTRYGDEQKLAPFMASLMAIVSFVADSDDTVRYVVAGDHKFVFLLKGPLYLVAICSTPERPAQIERQLLYIFNQVVSILTFSSITKIFTKRPDFDLRVLLGGTDRLLDNLAKEMGRDASLMLNAVDPLPLPAAVRNSVGDAMLSARCPELLFAILMCGFQLIQLSRPKRFTIDPIDIHMIMNFVNSMASLRSNETWTPLCLPMFDDKGFLHTYICYVSQDVCLVLLSTKADAFYKLAECKQRIVDSLVATGTLDQINEAVARPRYTIPPSVCQNMLHFMYKARNTRQMTTPALVAPYATTGERKRLLRLYQGLRDRAGAMTAAPHKLYYHVSQCESVIAWVTNDFEMYAAFGPLESKALVIQSCKKEADMFILNSPVW
eukprot:m51a1_g5871 putative duf254 family protein (668) ;mRNA; r:413986-417296